MPPCEPYAAEPIPAWRPSLVCITISTAPGCFGPPRPHSVRFSRDLLPHLFAVAPAFVERTFAFKHAEFRWLRKNPLPLVAEFAFALCVFFARFSHVSFPQGLTNIVGTSYQFAIRFGTLSSGEIHQLQVKAPWRIANF